MVAANSLRPFQRLHNGVLIYLRLDEWPADVPLLQGSALVETGDGPFCPYWRLILEPTRTIEVVIGWFKTPLSLDETTTWYQNEMEKQGWIRNSSQGHQEVHSAGLNFHHPETGVKVEISIRRWLHKQETRAMIRRVVQHPWPLAEERTAPAEEALPREEFVYSLPHSLTG